MGLSSQPVGTTLKQIHEGGVAFKIADKNLKCWTKSVLTKVNKSNNLLCL